jgi:hypothetical protein
MWCVYFVLMVAALIASLVLGSATYLERSAVTKPRTPFADHVPLPAPRPKQVSREIVDEEIVREVKDGKPAIAHRRKQPRGTW